MTDLADRLRLATAREQAAQSRPFSPGPFTLEDAETPADPNPLPVQPDPSQPLTAFDGWALAACLLCLFVGATVIFWAVWG